MGAINVADNDTLQVFAGSRVDARSLSEFMHKAADFMVQRRLAPPINTLQFYIDKLDNLANTNLNKLVRDALDEKVIPEGLITDSRVAATAKHVGGVARSQADINTSLTDIDSFGVSIDATDNYSNLSNAASVLDIVDLKGRVLKVSQIPEGNFANGMLQLPNNSQVFFGAASIAKTGDLRVGTWNTQYLRRGIDYYNNQPFGLARQADLKYRIRQIDCDIVGMQEMSISPYAYDAELWKIGKLQNAAFVKGANHSGYPFGNLLLTSGEFVNTESAAYITAPAENSGEKRTWVKITEKYKGKTVTTYNTHLSNIEANRTAMMQEFFDMLINDPSDVVFVVGDMNASDYANTFAPLLAAGFGAVNKDKYNTLIGYGFTPIDHIFYRGAVLVSEGMVEQPISMADHYFLYAEFNI